MITYLFIAVAIFGFIEFIGISCSDKPNKGVVAGVALIMSILATYSAVTLGTFGFVYGIILSTIYGISVYVSVFKGSLFGFLFNMTLMILFVIGISELNQ